MMTTITMAAWVYMIRGSDAGFSGLVISVMFLTSAAAILQDILIIKALI